MKTPTRRHVFVAGFMGTGKSAVGKVIAARLHVPFYDLDNVVVEMTGHSVPTIFKAEGEQAFRNYEARAMRLISGGSPSVISLGGGAPTIPAVANIMRHTGHTILLTASWESIWQRLAEGDERPLLADVLGTSDNGGKDEGQFAKFVARAEAILKERDQIYQDVADWSLDTSDLTAESAADRILELITAPVS